jgi:hypothetical protein
VSNLPSDQYLVSGLDGGPHTIVVTNLEDGKLTDIDYANVTQYVAGLGPQGNKASTPSSATTHKVPVGAIVGAVLGGLVLLVLLGFAFFRMRRRRNRIRHKTSNFSLDGDHEESHSASMTMAQPHPFDAEGVLPVTMGGRNKLAEAAVRATAPGNGTPASVFVVGSTSKVSSSRREEQEEEMDMPPPNYAKVFPGSQPNTSAVSLGSGSGLAWGAREPPASTSNVSKEGKAKV